MDLPGSPANGGLRPRFKQLYAVSKTSLLAKAGLAHTRENDQRLGRAATAAVRATEVRKMFRAGVSKSETARRLQIGRTSVRRILALGRPR